VVYGLTPGCKGGIEVLAAFDQLYNRLTIRFILDVAEQLVGDDAKFWYLESQLCKGVRYICAAREREIALRVLHDLVNTVKFANGTRLVYP
jgi:hypothetical protein